jgi:TRAP-type C4-dicarboxylate transport system substrate-binding protein
MIANERKWYRENDSEMLARLNGEGVRMSYPDKKPFQEASQKIYKMWAEKVGGMELIRQILDFDYQLKNLEEHAQR